MIEIPIKNGPSVLVSDEDGHLSRWTWSLDRSGYARRATHGPMTNGKRKTIQVYMHRVIAGAKHGEIVDHANRVKTDNRRENLRICTPAQNAQNRAFDGVSWHRKCRKWQASIKVNGTSYYLGIFASREEAVKVRREAQSRLCGSFAPREVA